MATGQESIYDFSANRIDGTEESLSRHRDKVLLIVNVASKCGFTPQYEGLEALRQKYLEHGFEVLAFPCNQFGSQEPGSGDEIIDFCTSNFGVSFPVFEKIEVNGEGTHRVYEWLKGQAPGLLGSRGIKWNFTKFLVDRDGRTVRRFAPQVTPESLMEPIEEVLAG